MMAAKIGECRAMGRSVRSGFSVSMAVVSWVLLTCDADAGLRHQYSFNTAAPAGGTFLDLVGDADGTLVGTATVSGGSTGQLILPGGGSGEAGNHASLLANGTGGVNINTYTNATFSLWATWNGAGDWQRYFDFGGHSVSSPTFAGNSIFMTANAGGADGVRLAISNIDLNTQAGFNNEQSISWSQTQTAGQERHIVGVFDGTNDQMRLYVNGIQVAQNTTPVTHMLSLLQTDAALLGAALYPDANFVGSINQFEVYDTALTGAEVVNLFVAGKIGEPQTPVPLLTINRDTGAMTLSNNTAPIQVLGYSITSAAGSLNSANWQTIANNFDATSGGEFDTDDEWTALSAAGSKTDFSEFTFDTTPGNGGLLGSSFSPQLGLNGAWRKSIYEDIQAQLKLTNGSTVDVIVNYTGNGNSAFDRSDLNFDGDITGADWLLFRTNNLVDLAAFSLAEAYAKGDLDGDRDNDFNDFLLFKTDYDNANGAGAFQVMLASVPEPATLGLLAPAMLLVIRRRGRRLTTDAVAHLPNVGQAATGRCRKTALALLLVGVLAASSHAARTHTYSFNSANLEDATGTADGALAGTATVSGFGQLTLPGGAADFATLPAPTIAINTYTDVTFEAWMTRSAAGGAWQRLFDFGDTNAGTGFGRNYIFYSPNSGFADNRAAVSDTDPGFNSEDLAVGGPALSLGTEHHIVVRYDSASNGGSGMMDVFVDGVLGGSVAITKPLSSLSNNFAYLGESTYPADANLVGSVNQFNIYNHAVSNTEIADSFYFGPTPSNLVALEVNKSTGQVTIKNNHSAALAIDHYSIVSRGGALNNSWSGLGSLDSLGAGEGQSWNKAGGADANELAELFLLGSSPFDPSESHSVGTAYNPAVFGAANGDLVFQYHLTTGERLYGPVTYVTGAAVSGDYNQDGVVNAADYTFWRNRLGQNTPLPNTNPADVDGIVTQAEYTYWKSRFGATSGSGSGAIAPAAVPEPASWLLAAGTAGGVLLFKGRRRTRTSPIQWSETMHCTTNSHTRSSLRRGFAALLLVVITGAAASAATKDRFYQFGDDSTENPVVGQQPQTDFGALTGDSAAIGPNDFSDLSYATGPVYVNTNALARPGSVAGEWGLTFNGVDTSLVRVNGGLGSPAIGDDDGVYAGNPNYTNITTRLMEGWVRPTNAALGRQDVVNDTAQFGIFISADDKWGLVHAATTIASPTAVAFNAWTHVMHRTFTNTAGALYVNGVAVAATPNDYNAGAAAANITFGSNLDQTANFFAGQLDNFSIYVSGNNSTETNGANWGAVNLATDNDFIRQQLIGKPNGDVNLDGNVNNTDVNLLVANWLTTKQVNGVTVGDMTTRTTGDLDFSGVVNLDDAFILHQGLLGAGAGGLDFSLLGANVPEPSTLLLLAGAAAAFAAGRTRRQRSH